MDAREGEGDGGVLVTVVMPVRNEGQLVEATIASLFAQTRPPDEIVIADGSSSDDTVERIGRWADRGIPIRVVDNDSIFAGGGRNRATCAASHDLIVTMDFGNRATPTWLAGMVRPFVEDPTLDLLAGIYHPIADAPFESTSAAVVYTEDCLLPAMDRAAIGALAPSNFVPGGMCMAYRRAIWERAGGFCEWARKGQDRLFGFRVRNVGGRVSYTLDAVVEYQMARSFGELFDRHFHYGIWAARTGLPSARFQKLAAFYGLILAALVASVAWPLLLLPILFVLLAYAYTRSWRKLDLVRASVGWRFGSRERVLAVAILFVRDAAILAGSMVGSLDRLLRPSWRRRTRAYLDHGRQ